ncbi:MAG: phosphoglucosamine mutase [Crenarchaeota archaeon 13_1_40CM_3_52_10]|nr:MAG: phosphoglucosamine mutase [Crenarchaeota archaeon 13_1_40CM_3_52_10]OLE71594.1 MAG: phosphoglucosamine mutase [archaeon 13_1_20CM_2_51_12]
MVKAPRLFGTNGIRGVAGREIDSGLAFRVGSALGALFPKRRVLIGRDGRLSSSMLLEGVAAGLLAQGNDVEDRGLITTPALEFMVKHTSSSVGVIITASHNPPEYNGFKVVNSDGIEIPRSKEEKMEALIHRDRWRAGYQPGQRVIREGQIGSYFEKLESQVLARDGIENLKIVVDAGNGVGALTTPRLLRKLGAHVIGVNDIIDGEFPGRNSEPRPENLGALMKIVREEKADLGIAHDGDGDRAIFVDETGAIQPGDRTLALIEDELLMNHPGAKIVAPINTSMVVSEVAKKRKGKLILTKVGSIEVSRTVVRVGALLGGEENGGIFYAPHHPVRDGTIAAVLVVNAIIRNGRPLSKLLDRLPKFYMIKEKIPCKEGAKDRAIGALKSKLKGRISSSLDGIRVDLKERGWILVRASGTEPLLRFYAEAKTESQLQEILNEFRPLVLKAVK